MARSILQLLSAIALLLGIAYFISAITTPGSYSLRDASAIQISQVYSEALYYAVLCAASFLFGIFLQLTLYFGNYLEQPQSIDEEITGIHNTLNKIGRVLQQQVTSGDTLHKRATSKSEMQTLLDREKSEF